VEYGYTRVDVRVVQAVALASLNCRKGHSRSAGGPCPTPSRGVRGVHSERRDRQGICPIEWPRYMGTRLGAIDAMGAM